MKTLLLLLAVAALAPAAAPAPGAAQTESAGVERFSKDGLSFDYPKGRAVEDKSGPQAQQLIMRRPGSSSLIMVVAQREPLRNREDLNAARASVTMPYVENLARQLGAKAPAAPDPKCLRVGAGEVAGYRVAGRLAQEPTTGEVYAVLKGQRLVHLVHIRHDKDAAADAAAWQKLADTLEVKPPAKPSPEASQLEGLVSGGVLQGKLLSSQQPDFPPGARAARASGAVVVEVTVDEQGNVSSARAVTGHPLLRPAGEDAARAAKFSPTMLCGKPVKVTGVITYNFVIGR